MVYVLFRIALAIFIAVMLTRLLIKFFRLQKTFNNSSSQRSNKKSEYLDMCPECGRVRDEGHRCP